MTSKIYLLLILFSGGMALAGDDDSSLAVANIPDSLKENSYAVVRNEELIYEVKDLNKAVLNYRISVTLLNNKSKSMSDISVFYDPGMLIKKLGGRKYDKDGNLLDELKSKDISDYSRYSGSLYDDNRIKNFNLSYAEYPYTFEYEFEQEINNLYWFPDWRPVDHFNMAVENSSFSIIIPKNLSFRYKAFNLADSCRKSEEIQKMIYTWQVRNIKAIEREPGMADIDRYMPLVITAPDKFIFEYPGEMTTWEAYGKWINTLNEGRDQLSPEKKALIRSMVDTIPSRKDKIKLLYTYLQKNTRYVSIQLGIGGLQPFEASFVDQNGYGDCKALVNYMKSLLSVAGIPSHYTLVNSGSYIPDIHVNFPSDQFDHVILCVPDDPDTIWLECTSQVMPFGYLGDFTDNRHVLIITEKGGIIARTPEYKMDLNLQIRKASVSFDPMGDALASISTKYSGLQYENIDALLDASPGDQQKWLYEHLDIPHFELKKFNIHANKASIPEAVENLELNMRRYVTVSGKRLFLQPNFINRQEKRSVPVKERVFELELRMPFIDVDTIDYEIPAGFHLEFMPKPVEIESRFGSYSSHIIQGENQIRYIRRRTSQGGIFPPESYAEFVNFINRIADADNMKLVFVNKT